MRPSPDFAELRVDVLLVNTPVKVLSVYDIWMEVEWSDGAGYHRGWVPAEWITLREPVPAERVTPTPTQ